MLGNGDGTFQAPAYIDAGTLGEFTYAIGDFNSDGKQDLLVSRYINAQSQPFTLFLGNGDGTFQPPQTMQGVYTNFGIVVGDLNSDGLLDFIVPSGGGLYVYTQKGARLFAKIPDTPGRKGGKGTHLPNDFD
jgi:hypothetical protein